ALPPRTTPHNRGTVTLARPIRMDAPRTRAGFEARPCMSRHRGRRARSRSCHGDRWTPGSEVKRGFKICSGLFQWPAYITGLLSSVQETKGRAHKTRQSAFVILEPLVAEVVEDEHVRQVESQRHDDELPKASPEAELSPRDHPQENGHDHDREKKRLAHVPAFLPHKYRTTTPVYRLGDGQHESGRLPPRG